MTSVCQVENCNYIFTNPQGYGAGPVSGYPFTAHLSTSEDSPKHQCVRHSKLPNPIAVGNQYGRSILTRDSFDSDLGISLP